jgi:type IV secretory pathway TraG/TraD family ATPase VirD4
MKSVLPFMTRGSGSRAIIYDAKRDTASLLPVLLSSVSPAPPTYILNPFDLRSAPWDMSRDIREGATALQVAGIFIPETDGESQPFFRNASRLLLSGVMEAFTRLAPDSWTLRDVILTLRYRERMVAVLSTHPETASLIPRYVSGKSRDDDVSTTLDTFMRPFSFVAAAWHHSEQPPVSLEQWASSEEILILGSDPKFDSILQPLNRAIFKRAVELVRRQPDVRKGENRQSWFFIDELRNAGSLEDIDKLLVEGRSKGACVVIGFQDLAGLREVFGEKRADEIIGACANKVFLQNGEGTTIDYATKHFKSQEILETKFSRSVGWSSSNNNSVSQQKVMRPVVHEGLLKSLPKPEVGRQGLNGYCDTASVGTLSPYRMELPHGFLDANLPRPDENVPGFLPRPHAHLELPEWTPQDLKRLGLEKLITLTVNEKPSQPKSPSPIEEDDNEEPDIFRIS